MLTSYICQPPQKYINFVNILCDKNGHIRVLGISLVWRIMLLLPIAKSVQKISRICHYLQVGLFNKKKIHWFEELSTTNSVHPLKEITYNLHYYRDKPAIRTLHCIVLIVSHRYLFCNSPNNPLLSQGTKRSNKGYWNRNFSGLSGRARKHPDVSELCRKTPWSCDWGYWEPFLTHNPPTAAK